MSDEFQLDRIDATSERCGCRSSRITGARTLIALANRARKPAASGA
jgi:hypothetical protein